MDFGDALRQTIFFVLIFGGLWYAAAWKNLFGLGANIKTHKENFLWTLLTAGIAGVVFFLLQLYL